MENTDIIESYGIVYTKVSLGAILMGYIPVQIVEGQYDNVSGTFKDIYENVYDNVSSPEILESNEPRVVGSVISKEALLERFPDLSTQEAMKQILDEADENLHFGIVDDDIERIRVFTLPYNSLMANMANIQPYNIEQIAQYDSDETIEEVSYTSEGTFRIDIKTLKEIASLPNAEDIRNRVQEYILLYDKLGEYLDKEKEADEEEEYEEPITIEEALPLDMTNSRLVFGFDIKWVIEELKKQIINQDETIEKVVSAIAMDRFADRAFDRERILLCGPTGTGKTQIMRSLCSLIDKPYVIVPTTQLTSSGYVGADLEDYLRELIRLSDGDVEKAESGIVILDEIDKNASDSGRNNDVSFKSVLNALLPFLEDNIYDVPVEKGKGHVVPTIRFKTGKLTIFASGSFEDILRKKSKARPMGFSPIKNISENHIGDDITIEDFINAGVPVELMGRFPIIVWTNPHDENTLKQILIGSTISPLIAEQNKLQNINIELTYDESFVDECAKAAIKLGFGARTLKSIVEKAIGKAKFTIIHNLGTYTRIHLTGDAVLNPEEAIIVDNNNQAHIIRNILNGASVITDTDKSKVKKLDYYQAKV